MGFTSTDFTTLLLTMGLSQGAFKPSPYPVQPTGPASKLALSNNQTEEFYQPPWHNFDTQGNGCAVQPYQIQDTSVPPFPPYDQSKATVFRYRQQQSVNLGSWFVHEQWMTPSLFTCASGDKMSELDIASGWGSLDSARALLERHWDSFIRASDFQYLAGLGINTVRLPIGYWSLGPDFCQGTPFEPVAAVYQNAWSRVVRAINMAADSGIGVLVDLHGAPGSQNGQQHSGVSDGQVNLFGNDWYENKTMTVLTYLTRQLVNVTNVVGIQILNEPRNDEELADFYSRAISTMRQADSAAASFPLYIHDGFDLERFSDFVANRSDFVVQDHHSYFVFTSSDEMESVAGHIEDVRTSIATDLAQASSRQRRNLVVDEFSCALTPESLAQEDDPDDARREFCQGQMNIYQNDTAGWSFWAYDKEDCDDDPGWCFKAAVGKSLPSTFFSYGKGPPAIDPSRIPALADMVPEMGSTGYPSSSGSSSTAPSSTSGYEQASSGPLEVGLFPSMRWSRFGAERERERRTPLRYRRTDQWGWRRDTDPTDAGTGDQLPIDPEQRAIAKGYSDGYTTAKIFALYGLSKLGFSGQYVSDSLAKLGKVVVQPGMEGYYAQWFMEGLRDGESLVSSAVN